MLNTRDSRTFMNPEHPWRSIGAPSGTLERLIYRGRTNFAAGNLVWNCPLLASGSSLSEPLSVLAVLIGRAGRFLSWGEAFEWPVLNPGRRGRWRRACFDPV